MTKGKQGAGLLRMTVAFEGRDYPLPYVSSYPYELFVHPNPRCDKQMNHLPLWTGDFQCQHITEFKQNDFLTGLESVVLKAFLRESLDLG